MTLILPNTPFYRTAENCGQFYDSIYVPNYTPYNYSLPVNDGDRSYYLQVSNGADDFVLNRDILDMFDNGLIVTTIIEDGKIQVFGEYGFEYVDLDCNSWQLALVSGIVEDDIITDIEEHELIGCVSFISEVQCKSKIKITYELYCGYEYKFNYYLKGHLNRQPAISDENISFLGTNGQPNVLFSITHLPMMLTTGVMGWREQQFLEQILNKNDFMINGNSVNKADGAIFTVRNSATKGLIGSILLIASTIVFNACCKDYEALPQNYRVDNVRLVNDFVDFTFADEYVSGSGAWVGTSDGIIFNFITGYYDLDSTWLNANSTIDGMGNYVLQGITIANRLKELYNADPNPNKPEIVFDGNKMSISNVNYLPIDQISLYFYNSTRLFPTFEDYVLIETWSYISYPSVPASDYEIDVDMHPLTFLFFVKINDIWVEKTNEVFNGSWKVLNTTDNVTEWRITQSDGTTVVQSGQVIAF